MSDTCNSSDRWDNMYIRIEQGLNTIFGKTKSETTTIGDTNSGDANSVG